MPNYTFENKITGKSFVKHLKMSEREKYLSDHPDIKQILTDFKLMRDGWNLDGAIKKRVSGDMKDRISEIKNHHHKSTINTNNISEI